jgi:hypothetical protein
MSGRYLSERAKFDWKVRRRTDSLGGNVEVKVLGKSRPQYNANNGDGPNELVRSVQSRYIVDPTI